MGAIAATLEALVHLRSRSTNWLDDAQHAIAAARSQQHSASTSGLTQVETMIYILDIACSLNPYDYKQAGQKMHAMHDYFKSTPQDKQDHNVVSLPVGQADEQLISETAGIFKKTETGQLNLNLAWVDPLDLFVVGSLLSGLALWRRNSKEGRTEPLFRDALQHLEGERTCLCYCTTTNDVQIMMQYRNMLAINQLLWRIPPRYEEELSTHISSSIKPLHNATEKIGPQPRRASQNMRPISKHLNIPSNPQPRRRYRLLQRTSQPSSHKLPATSTAPSHSTLPPH